MNETLSMVTALALGFSLGAMFFAGLWLTVRHGLSSEHPALWFLSSLLLRSVIVLTGFYYVARGSGANLLICLFGFFFAHRIVIRFAQTAKEKSFQTQEISHEPKS